MEKNQLSALELPGNVENELKRVTSLISSLLLNRTKQWLAYFQHSKMVLPDCIAVMSKEEVSLEWNDNIFTVCLDLFSSTSFVKGSVFFVNALHDEKTFKDEPKVVFHDVVEWLRYIFKKYQSKSFGPIHSKYTD
jgi:hypothetical protein